MPYTEASHTWCYPKIQEAKAVCYYQLTEEPKSTNERINSQESSQISMWSQFSRKWAKDCKSPSLAGANTACSSHHWTAIWEIRVQSLVGKIQLTQCLHWTIWLCVKMQRSTHLCCAVQLILNHTALGSDDHTHFLYIGCQRSRVWHLQCPPQSLLWPSCQHPGQANSLKYGIGAFKHTL